MNILESMEALLGSNTVKKDVARKSTLLRQGDISDKMYIVETGCLRLWHNDDGDDTTVQFFLAGEAVSSFKSFIRAEPSQFGIEAIVSSTIKVVKKKNLLNLMEKSPEFKTHMFEMLISRLINYQSLFLNMIAKTPKQRYLALLEQNPSLFETVPQHYIASYLGVTPVSLSRIRSSIENS